MPVIKAGHETRFGGAAASLAVNAAEAAERAARQIEAAERRAQEIISQAEAKAVEIQQQAEIRGRQAAMEAAVKLARQEIQQQIQEALPAASALAQQIEAARQEWLATWRNQAIELAVAIAERILRRQLPLAAELPATLVQEALELATGSRQVRVRMHPDDLSALRREIEAVVAAAGQAAQSELLPDPTISRGGCRLETQYGVIDQTIEAQLARIEEELK